MRAQQQATVEPRPPWVTCPAALCCRDDPPSARGVRKSSREFFSTLPGETPRSRPASLPRPSGPANSAVKHTIVDKARMLRGVPLLSEVSTEVLADLAALSGVEDHADGTVLFSEGEPPAWEPWDGSAFDPSSVGWDS